MVTIPIQIEIKVILKITQANQFKVSKAFSVEVTQTIC